jgi:hypothetical protein
MFCKGLILAATLLAGTLLGALAQTVTPLPPSHLPFDGIVYGFLLTEGSILFQAACCRIFTASFPTRRATT